MVFEFKFPDVGEGITEGEIVKWRVKEGQSVKQDEIIADVETDKAVVEIPSPRPGTILKIHHKEGDVIKVGETLVTIGDKGDKAPEPEKAQEKPQKKEKPKAKKESFGVVGDIPEDLEEPVSEPVQEPEEKEPQKTGKALALPAVRRLAKELDVDLEKIQGSGKHGRITEEDVRGSKGKATPAMKVTKKYDMWGYVERQPLKGIRKATSKHMIMAVSKAALVVNIDEADVTELWDLRKREKEKAEDQGVHLTFMPFIIKAVIKALEKHPILNASLDEETEEIVLKKYYNIGIAVDMEGGLIVPVLKGADEKSILEIGKELQELSEKARERKVDLADLKGGTFTITNVGSIGGMYATPIPNYPEVSILATGRIKELPRVVDGRIQARRILPLSLTFDHRVLDGAEAARFTVEVIRYLEDPTMLLME